MAKETIDQIARRLAESLPEGARAVRQDLEQNFRSILTSGLTRLDLVTREEFDVQEAVLARTRAKLEALEVRLGEIEAPTTGSASTQPASKKSAAAKSAKKKSAKKSIQQNDKSNATN